MRKILFSRSTVPATVVVALALLIPGQASANQTAGQSPPTATSCPTPDVSQPFLSWGDDNWYTPAPGVTPDSFTADGWTLSGGAQVVTATLADGTTGPVLDLPAGASATSPVVCVDSSEPTASMITLMLGTGSAGDAARFYVTPAGSSKLIAGMPVSSDTRWAESRPANVFRGVGAAYVNLTIASNLRAGDLEVYDLFIDPRMRY